MKDYNLTKEINKLPHMTMKKFLIYASHSLNPETYNYEFCIGVNSFITGDSVYFHEDKQTFTLTANGDFVGEISVVDLDKYPIYEN